MQQIPTHDHSGWQDLQAHQSQYPQGRTMQRLRRIGGGLVAVAAVLLVVLGFVQVLSGRIMQVPASSAHLAWKQSNVPLSIARGYLSSSWHALPTAANDANTMYGCVVPRDADPPVPASPQVWVTHDRGVHWIQPASLPISRQDVTLCYLTVDDLDTDTVVAVVGWPQAPLTRVFSSNQAASFVTRDGGRTWKPLEAPSSFRITQLATFAGRTIAYFDSDDPAGKRLMASDNGMQSWYPIDQPIFATGQHVWQFAANPTNNAIFAQVGKDGDSMRQLWETTNGGATWMRLPAPTAVSFFIGPVSASDHPPYICATQYALAPYATAPNALTCSDDGGQHWVPRPMLSESVTVPLPHDPHHTVSIASPRVLGVTDDGALLAIDNGQTTHVLYRLLAGANQWQLLGPLPLPGDIQIRYFTRPGDGVLWAYDINNMSSGTDHSLYTVDYR